MKKTKIKENKTMQNELKIEELFIVNGETFYSKEDAQEYIDDIQKERSKNEYHDTIYYENWTTSGKEAERQICHTRWQTLQEALDAMTQYSNSWRPYGTGWINKVTITKNPNGCVRIKTEKVYERD